MNHDVFLSYARQDMERAKQIKELLEGLGLSVFFDTEGLDGGDVFPDVLDNAVKSASAVVGVWSKHSLTREWVKIECDIGRIRRVLVPVQIEMMGPLDRPAAFHNIQYDDLSDFDGDPDHAGWLRFLRSLARVLDRPELLERETAAQEATPDSADADVRAELEAMRAEMAAMRQSKAALAAAVQQQPVQEVTAVGLGVWQEIKDGGNVDAMRRFLETVRNTPLEHVVRGKIEELEAPAQATTKTVQVTKSVSQPSSPPKSKLPWVIGGLLAVAAVVAGVMFGPGLMESDNLPIPGEAEYSADTADAVDTSSVAYHEQACADGIAEGCMSAGTAYAYGEGVPADQYVALSYYQLGCELDDFEACWIAGIAHEQAKDYETAESFYALACKGGEEDGCELLKSLDAMLSKEGN